MRTEVCITIDTEFSIGGAFEYPISRRPLGLENVYCPVNGKDEGLPFILRTLARYAIRGTFFVEALNTVYFGDRPMRSVAEAILAAGQDVQLHLHPCWLHFNKRDWMDHLKLNPPNDSCAGRSAEEMIDIISLGMNTIVRWTGCRPLAIRTGNLQADRAVYTAMSRVGIRLGSNIGLALYRPRDVALQLHGGRHWIDDVMEVPVLTYTELKVGARVRHHLLTITGTGESELISLLRMARAKQISPVVILAHPFEFIKGDSPGGNKCARNRINQRRLEAVCRFISEHPAEFVGVSFGEAASRWITSASMPASMLRAPLLPVMRRVIENKANDLLRAI